MQRDWIRFTTSYAEVTEADAVCITVGTPLDDEHNADLPAIDAVVTGIPGHLRPGHPAALALKGQPETDDVRGPVGAGLETRITRPETGRE